jgi:4'-phosphopantetheinyl transferase
METSPGEGMIDVWSASLEPPEVLRARLVECLSSDERARAERFVFPRDRHRFVAGRAFLRLLLAQYLGTDAGAIEFRYGPHGKPFLAHEQWGLRFNLAHAGGLAVCALARGGELGVDVERVRPLSDAEAVARSNFSPRENAALAALPEGDRLRGFFEAWTRKEAFLKALGDGLARPLDSFDVSLGPGEEPRLLQTLENPAEAAQYSLHAFDPEPGYVAALAVTGQGWTMNPARWRWVH